MTDAAPATGFKKDTFGSWATENARFITGGLDGADNDLTSSGDAGVDAPTTSGDGNGADTGNRPPMGSAGDWLETNPDPGE